MTSGLHILFVFGLVGYRAYGAGASLVLAVVSALLAGCSSGGGSSRYGPRIVELGQPVPKGGGTYRVGSPYSINGQTYYPQESPNYDRTGIASWYGEDFHGRRTANGEIYDMEALTAAHPTLPIPSYVRVTNLRNGRSLVARVNDRGPFVGGRAIDLSWAAATLLDIERYGTGPVRVQYLGAAPIDGNDSYERQMLARQTWAGPRVAFAASPAKALRDREANGPMYSQNETPASTPKSMAMNDSLESTASASADTASQHEPSIGKVAETKKFLAADRPQPSLAVIQPLSETPASFTQASIGTAFHRMGDKPHAVSASNAQPVPEKQRPVTKHSATAATAAKPKPIFIEAGIFPERATADKLASILKEIAPASVEPAKGSAGPAHRLRLGPFAASDDAHSVMDRIRGAGLKNARLLADNEI